MTEGDRERGQERWEQERETFTGRIERETGQKSRLIQGAAPDRHYESGKETEQKAEPLDCSGGRISPASGPWCMCRPTPEPSPELCNLRDTEKNLRVWGGNRE